MKESKIICLLILLLISTSNSFAQNEEVQKSHSIKGPIVGLSYSYEHPITSQSVLIGEIILHGGFNSFFLNGFEVFIAPAFRFESRFYTNFKRRYEKGKKNINNSANFLAIAFDFQPKFEITEYIGTRQYFEIIPKWGFKRTLGEHITIETSLGLGRYYMPGAGGDGIAAIDFKLGYAF